MEFPLTDVTDALTRYGPAALAVMAFLETAFLTGLVVPAGVALLFASFLASKGVLTLPVVVSWAVAGAIAGDSAGFWVGRRIRTPGSIETRGWFRRTLATVDPRRLAVLRRSPLYSVTLARLIPFVRTLMPISAGRSDLTYARFLAFELLGVSLWAASYVSAGFLAGESWRLMSGWVGGFWTTVFALVLVIGSLGGRRAHGRVRPVAAEKGPSEMLSIGLTGNLASGKSAVARIWSTQGLPTLSADELAREVVEPGSDGLSEVVRVFGENVLSPDGTLDRAALRARVFRDDGARRALEGILHPLIAARRREWMDRQRAEGATAVAYEMPLLFETGHDGEFDVIVFVDAPVETRLRRLEEKRGIEREEAERMMSAQMPAAKKRAASHVVIENHGSLEELETAASEALSRIEARTGAGGGGAP